MDYPRRLGEVRSAIQRLREREISRAGSNPSLNPKAMTPENSARLFGAIDSLWDMENGLRGLWWKIERGETPTQLECLGFLSALYIQQDCVCDVYRALGRANFTLSSELKAIRDIRNRVAGHAAFAQRAEPPGSAMWKADTISHNGFEMVIYYVSGGTTEFIDFRKFIQTNNDGLADLLQVILDELNQPDR